LTNPLASHFRSVQVHQSLPTGGQYFDPGTIEMGMTGELAVMPMTARDEIMLKNPDALLNGEAVMGLIASCVPGIKEPRRVSVPDLDVILLAIKLASFGDELEMQVRCPKCEKDFEVKTSIRALLAQVKPIDHKLAELRVADDLLVHLRPYDYEAKTILEMATFEETKIIQFMVDTEVSMEEKQERFGKAFEKMAELNLDLLGRCVSAVLAPGGKVVEADYILEWIKNADRRTVKLISDRLTQMSESGLPKEVDMTCPEKTCQHTWKTPMVFDASHFFASGS
jgi:hypothetical protein